MAPSDDLKAHAASSQDFYGLLDVSQAATESEIRRAYRRTALKYHPDKIANPTPADIEKFHLLQIAYDVLSDPSVRQLYNNAREARERKRRETEMMDAAKRKMKEDLEARERAGDVRGVKRSWMTSGNGGACDDDAEAKLEREIQRIVEDTRRRRREAEDQLKREAEEEKGQQEEESADHSSRRINHSNKGGSNVPELERSIKVRWFREGEAKDVHIDALTTLFSAFGKITNIFFLKDKRQRIGEKREKKIVATGVIVFASIVSAHAAVVDSEKKEKSGAGLWSIIESVSWASGRDPNNEHSQQTPPFICDKLSVPRTSESATKCDTFDFLSLKSNSIKSATSRPSFASFSSATSGMSSTVNGRENDIKSLSTPSLEEVTLMHLKTAQREKERRVLEEQLRKEDEAADTATAP